MSNYKSESIGILQEISEATGELMDGLINDELHLRPDNDEEWADVVGKIGALLPALLRLKRHTWPAPAVDPQHERTYHARFGRMVG